jgi:hypothetical protein
LDITGTPTRIFLSFSGHQEKVQNEVFMVLFFGILLVHYSHLYLFSAAKGALGEISGIEMFENLPGVKSFGMFPRLSVIYSDSSVEILEVFLKRRFDQFWLRS